MNKVETFKILRQDFQNLTYENHENQDKLSIRFTALISKFIDSESAYIKKFDNVSFTSGTNFFYEPKSKEIWMAGHKHALQLIDDVIEDIELFDTLDRPTKKESLITKDSSKVFIVHGHDDGAKETVARFVDKLGFKAVILHEQVDSGATIIEKLGKHTDVGFAIVLYTECDIGGVIKSNPEDLKPRARQNVIFEHGLLIGKIGRANVVALVKGNVEIPNDISGVVYKSMDTSGAWKYSIAREMKSSGYDVDMNKID
ncbi:TIR domain-containing protein [Psychrobacter fozii]|uniref:Putative nucleotide-binding protein with TIR-like domain n=1 Tax=Psychrobacter fozii TaxID=198480 RepID=A0A2V4VHS9_9GAMM|nr:nucleotide-binding protein [Psychrobacter fozii]PYE38385.1 putative nucleotide-binding protein with TIR-like domain [Psychrobacter fozii]